MNCEKLKKLPLVRQGQENAQTYSDYYKSK